MFKTKNIFKVLMLFSLLYLFSNTYPVFAEEINFTENDTLYCKVVEGKNCRFAIDFIFIVNMQGKIQNAAKIINTIGTKQFLKNYLSDDVIYFHDKKNTVREINKIKFLYDPMANIPYALGYSQGNKLKPQHIYRENIYLGSNKKAEIINLNYPQNIKNEPIYEQFLKLRDKHIKKVINKIKLRTETQVLIHQKSEDYEEIIMFDLDNDGLKDLVASFKTPTATASVASILVIYGNQKYKSIYEFEHKNDPPAESSRIVGITDIDKNGKCEIILSNIIKDLGYYLLLDGENINNIIFRSSYRHPKR